MEEVKKRRRLQVGLLVGALEDDFDAAVSAGAMDAAQEMDVNLAVFPGRYINGVYKDRAGTQYEYQHHTIFDIPTKVKFDVLLVLMGSLGGHLSAADKKAFLKKFDGTPVITITSRVEGYPCIMIDNRSGMGDAVRHLIREHNCKKIGFVSGPKTNDDAIERMAVYRQILEDNGIEYDEGRVVYGNFSRYINDRVEELLNRNPDLDAIVFSNDQMAFAGYEVIKKHGLKVGQDIRVTGFDNDPICMDLIPHLTTVKADSRELGYQSVIEAVNYIMEGEMETEFINSHLVVRDSCGCDSRRTEEIKLNDCIDDAPGRVTEVIGSYLFGTDHFDKAAKAKSLKNLLTLDTLSVDNILETKAQNANSAMLEIMEWIREGRIDTEKFYTVMEVLHSRCCNKTINRNKLDELNRLFTRFYRDIAAADSAAGLHAIEENDHLTLQTNAITKDMLVFDTFDDNAYLTVMDKLNKLALKSAYIYSYEPFINHPKEEKWVYPEQVLLKSYCDGSRAYVIPADEQKMRVNDILSNRFMPQDRRYTIIINPLFTNEEQYGLLFTEIDPEHFNVLQAVTFQLDAAMKIISLVRKQEQIEKQLRNSLIEVRENNQLLSELSKIDALTGMYNRRGLYEGIRKNLNKEENNDRKAFMIFSDLDSLKTINDMFGHEEGDFAIKGAGAILTRALGDGAVIGRLGGDEFAACVYPDDSMTVKKLRELVEEVTESFNEEFTADKKYRVHLSVGVFAFKSAASVEIGELLSHADALLYEQKRRKNSILKE